MDSSQQLVERPRNQADKAMQRCNDVGLVLPQINDYAFICLSKKRSNLAIWQIQV